MLWAGLGSEILHPSINDFTLNVSLYKLATPFLRGQDIGVEFKPNIYTYGC